MRTSIDPSLQQRKNLYQNPYMDTHLLYMGKVIASNPENGTVDIAIDGANGQGGTYHNVPVMSWSMGVQTGMSYFPTVDHAVPIPFPQGTYDQPLTSGKQDIWCIVGHLNGRAQRPVVLGFINPLNQNTRSNTVGDRVDVHESGVYSITTKEGDFEVHFPDGGYILISPGTTPVDMTQKNANWTPATSANTFNVTMNFSGTVVVNAPTIILGAASGGEAVARIGDTVNLSTGVIETGSSKVFSG